MTREGGREGGREGKEAKDFILQCSEINNIIHT